jgi:hypothetical protein
MKYFDLVPVGQLVTGQYLILSPSRVFQSGIIYDYKWLNEDGGRIVFMFYMNWQLTWIVVVQCPFWYSLPDISTQDETYFWHRQISCHMKLVGWHDIA